MSYVPTLCQDCQRVALCSLQAAHSHELWCQHCHGKLRIIPSRSFGGEDATRFNELAQVVSIEVVSPVEAQERAFEIQRVLRAGSVASLLNALAERFPGLMPFRLVVGDSQRGQRQMLATLGTILDALATARGKPREAAESSDVSSP